MILEMFFRPKGANDQKNYHNILIGFFWYQKMLALEDLSKDL